MHFLAGIAEDDHTWEFCPGASGEALPLRASVPSGSVLSQVHLLASSLRVICWPPQMRGPPSCLLGGVSMGDEQPLVLRPGHTPQRRDIDGGLMSG